MKECPECSMFNSPGETRCKWCGASLGSGSGGESERPAASRREEDPRVKEEQEKEARKKRIITWVGYGVLGAALIGYMVYMQVKRGKEEKAAAKDRAGQQAEEGNDDTSSAKEGAGSSLKQVEKAIALGDRVPLDASGLGFAVFKGAVAVSPVEGQGNPAFAYRAKSADGSQILTVRLAENPAGAVLPAADAQARLLADWILGQGKPVAIPGKGDDKCDAGPWFMIEADHGDRLERVYWIFTAHARVELSLSYPATGEGVAGSRKLAEAIVSSMKAVDAPAQATSAVPATGQAAAAASPATATQPAKSADPPAPKAPAPDETTAGAASPSSSQ